MQSESHFSLTLNECSGGNPKRLSGPAIEQDGLILWKQETVRSRWVTDRTSRSKSKPKKARLEVFPKEEQPRMGVDFQDPHLGEKHPNSPLDLMGDPFHLSRLIRQGRENPEIIKLSEKLEKMLRCAD